jgi:hypothetical protein
VQAWPMLWILFAHPAHTFREATAAAASAPPKGQAGHGTGCYGSVRFASLRVLATCAMRVLAVRPEGKPARFWHRVGAKAAVRARYKCGQGRL